MNEPLVNLLRRAADLQRAGQRVAACLLVRARGSTPQSAGALMLVDEAMQTFGTIGGGCVEAEVRREAFRMMMSEQRTGQLTFKLNHDYGWDDGLICGGTITLAVGELPSSIELERLLDQLERRQLTALPIEVHHGEEPGRWILDLPPRERLLIAGAGHVGQALARLALHLEFEVTLIDDREDLLAAATPDGAGSLAGDIARSLRDTRIDPETYVVIVTRGHRHDEQALHAVVERGARYVGMIGSRRKVKLIFDDLRELGVGDAALAAVHAPVGLDIGAVTVEEIAISIAAQLVEARRRERRPPVRFEPADVEVAAR